MKIGILALQGAVRPHIDKLEQLGVTAVEVRTPESLIGLMGIILPGGESSAMIHLLKLNQLWEPLKEFVKTRPTLGVCAGAILLAKSVSHPTQESLEAMDIEAVRNAYGRQNESFIAVLDGTHTWESKIPFEGVFIRAPQIKVKHSEVTVLFTYKKEPVMVQQGHCLAATFHPELTSSTEIHQYFLNITKR